MILRRGGQDARGMAGVTLLEILVAMLIVGLVATGIVISFIFSRRMTWRSSTELSSAGLVTEVAENLRGAVGVGALANGLSLQPGIYSNAGMQNSPAPNDLDHRLAVLDLPPDFQRFLTNNGTGPNIGDQNNDGQPDHGDGRLVVVEDADHPAAVPPTTAADLDGDGQKGVSFDGRTTALRRVRIRIKWTPPSN